MRNQQRIERGGVYLLTERLVTNEVSVRQRAHGATVTSCDTEASSPASFLIVSCTV